MLVITSILFNFYSIYKTDSMFNTLFIIKVLNKRITELKMLINSVKVNIRFTTLCRYKEFSELVEIQKLWY